VPAATDGRTDEGLAMTALELFGFGLPAGRRPVGPLWPAVRCVAPVQTRLIILFVVDPIVPRSCSGQLGLLQLLKTTDRLLRSRAGQKQSS